MNRLVVAGARDAQSGNVLPSTSTRAPAFRSRPFWWASAKLGIRLGILAALGLWAADVVLLLPQLAMIGAARWMQALASAFFVATTTAVVLGAVVGALLNPGFAALWRWIAAPSPLISSATGPVGGGSARVLSVILIAPLWAVSADRLSFMAVLGMAQPSSMALALTALHLALLAVVVLLWPLAGAVAHRLVARALRVRWMAPLVATGARTLAALALIASASLLVLACRYRAEMRALPYREYLAGIGLVIGLSWGAWSIHRPARAPRAAAAGRVQAALVALTAACTAIAAFNVQPTASQVQKLAFERALSGRWGYAAWTAAFDFDRDGQLGMLGGGDCAPFDATRYLGAIDIPHNGIDEDCDGTDLVAPPLQPVRRPALVHNILPYRPTVVLVSVDGLSAQRLKTLGSATSLLPNLDALAERSMVFTNCFAQGPSTRLSLPSLFTSRWDSQLVHLFAPRHPYPLAPTELQLQDVLNAAGYETAAVLPNAYFDRPNWSSVSRGFQQVDTSALQFGKHNAPQVTDAALAILAAPRSRPLFLWVHYFDAHGPYEPLPGVTYAHSAEQDYHNAELTYIDRELGRLFTALDARANPAYTIVAADHGTVFHPDPAARRSHYGYDLYTATLHVPLVIRGPNVTPGRADGLVSLMDVAPTVIDLVNAPAPPPFEGNSLLTELQGGASPSDRTLFHEFYLSERGFRGQDPLQYVSIRTARWNMIVDRERGAVELYDWQRDYWERHDVYEEEAHSADIMKLRSSLSAFVTEVHRPSSSSNQILASVNTK